MIKQLFSLFALTLPLSVSAQAQHKLSAQITGLGPDVTVFLSNVDNPNKAETLDSAKVAADGSFSFAMPLQKPRMCNVTFWKAGKTRSYKISSLSLLLDGSEDVSLKGDTAQLFSTDRETILGINGGGKTLADWLDYKRYIQKQQDVADDASYREADAFLPMVATRVSIVISPLPKTVRQPASTPCRRYGWKVMPQQLLLPISWVSVTIRRSLIRRI